jgi:hypothetical protein
MIGAEIYGGFAKSPRSRDYLAASEPKMNDMLDSVWARRLDN